MHSEAAGTNGLRPNIRLRRNPPFFYDSGSGIFLIITGWMFRWLTSLTLLMYPILLIFYYKLARNEIEGKPL
jgi:hypothetical protein